MKKFLLTFVSVIVLLSFMILYAYSHYTVDTKCAKRFAEVLSNYDIREIDSYFNNNTKILYKNNETVYKNCRTTVIRAFDKKKFEIPETGSYGYGNNKFVNGVQAVSVRLMGNFNGESLGECMIEMNIKKDGLFGYKIESAKCDNDIFGYMFFGYYNN